MCGKNPSGVEKPIGHLDTAKIARMSPSKLEKIFGQRPAIHRYKKNVAGWVQDACRRIVAQYGGKPENIWHDEPSAGELEIRFREFKGVGQKKASMAVNIMVRDGLIPLKKERGVDLSVDVNVSFAALIARRKPSLDKSSKVKLVDYIVVK